MASVNGRTGKVRIALLTGLPGVGKTTMARKIADNLVSRKLKVAGIITSEVRENGHRIGFRITDLATGEEGWLARKESRGGPRMGSYRIDMHDLELIGVEALRRLIRGIVDFVIIDEVGPMEMTSPSFRSSLVEVFHGTHATLATVKLGSRYEEIEAIRNECLQLELTSTNREEVYATLTDQINHWIIHDGN